MKKSLHALFWAAALLVLVFVTAPGASAQEDTVPQGLTHEDGNIYYYNEDGTLFTEGYKEVTVDGVTRYYFFQEDGTAFTGGYKPFNKEGQRVYYYFQEDGTAYTDGYLSFEVAEKRYYFYFQEDGSAFTDGYKEIELDGELRYFYFLANGQAFNTGYKTVMIDGRKHYFYFGEDAQAVTGTLVDIPLGERTAYMLFGEDGKAFTNGYKQVDDGDHYYFLTNGQAFTTGYKTVKIDGTTYYFYFENNGKAFTQGWKDVPFGTLAFTYYFQEDGRAVTGWKNLEGTDYYFQKNGRVARDAFVTIDEKLYYFDESYTIVTGGWFCVAEGYYFADEEGALLTNTVLEGYALDENGRSATKYRIIQYANEHTDPAMTDQEKIDALYKWILENDMKYIRNTDHTKKDWEWKDSWVSDMADQQMDNWGGNCYRYASFFGMMVSEATGLPVAIYHGKTEAAGGGTTAHGWAAVEQEGVWYVYDPELQKHSHVKEKLCYKVLLEDSDLHMEGVGTRIGAVQPDSEGKPDQ